jgi:hypothetical protein
MIFTSTLFIYPWRWILKVIISILIHFSAMKRFLLLPISSWLATIIILIFCIYFCSIIRLLRFTIKFHILLSRCLFHVIVHHLQLFLCSCDLQCLKWFVTWLYINIVPSSFMYGLLLDMNGPKIPFTPTWLSRNC